MEIIAVVESDEYGPAIILDPDHITVVKCEDFYLGATRCMYTDKPITCEISESTAKALIKKGVKCINAFSEEQI